MQRTPFTPHYIYIYAFSRRFYPKRLTVYSGYTFFVSMCSLGIEPTTFALLTQCSTTEPQELCIIVYVTNKAHLSLICILFCISLLKVPFLWSAYNGQDSGVSLIFLESTLSKCRGHMQNISGPVFTKTSYG